MGNQQQPSQGTSGGSKNFGSDQQKGNKGSQTGGGQGSHSAGSGSTTGDPGRTPQKGGNTMNDSKQSGEGRQSTQQGEDE